LHLSPDRARVVGRMQLPLIAGQTFIMDKWAIEDAK
jgi:hypothetical protein